MSKFFFKLKGEKEDHSHLNSASSSSTLSSNNPSRYTDSQPPAYQAPPGPPPSHRPERQATSAEDNPPPYHDWQTVPDNSLLPPPPPLKSDYSNTTNASYDEAAAAHAWCAAHPVFTPRVANASVIQSVMSGRNGFTYPPGASQRGWSLVPSGSEKQVSNALGAIPTSVYQILSPSNPSTSSNGSSSTQSGSKASGFSRFMKSSSNSKAPASSPADHCWASTLPVYFAATSNPLSPHFASPKPHPFTIYFEITPLKYYSEESTVAIGFVSKPYPENRQPGWHRASIGVHSDDGNRYVNDSWGGREFTTPFREGESIGLAIVVSPQEVSDSNDTKSNKSYVRYLQSDKEVRSTLPKCKTRVYLTRNGTVTGSWEMDEERDAERDEGVAGLQGEVDVYAAVGTFGDVDVEVKIYAQGEGFLAPPA
ncbi:hypothetical protein PMZ80_002433 [Knufia obscura]|uniref:SPRY domain-containing protein n=2 Tax=Knufia TaxID=430999 RepID=A0AAN8EGC2_9EURO|nr:hypothetical protein PMZ80_002433 [Knufia obscura]KAK5950858.1 hypothetical protein OHC33_008241 [Knufia fluminis]